MLVLHLAQLSQQNITFPDSNGHSSICQLTSNKDSKSRNKRELLSEVLMRKGFFNERFGAMQSILI